MSESEPSQLVDLWLSSADADISMAALGLREGLYDPACFHCQQAAEKSLKAYLLTRGQGIIRTHSLQRLLRECVGFDNTFDALDKDCSTLTGFYTATRYPDTAEAIETYGQQTAQDALTRAHHVVDVARAAIDRRGAGGGGAA
jgi:HEPN domain-containing protein